MISTISILSADGNLAAHRADLAFETAHPRFHRIAADDLFQPAFGKGDVFRRQPVFRDLPRREIAFGDLHFLLFGIAVDLDDLHPVEQRIGNGVEGVRRGDENDLGQIVRHFQIPVAESVILFGVEHFQKGARGVAVNVVGKFIDLVEQKHRIGRARAAHPVDDPAGHRPHVGAPVPADLRLVLHAAEAHAHELSAQRARHRFGDGGLAYPRRADETEHRTLDLFGELQHRKVFHDALLHVFQPEMIAVKDGFRLRQAGGILRIDVEGQFLDPVEIV